MEISAIMNINELAANRRVKPRGDFPERKHGEVFGNKKVSAIGSSDGARDLKSVETKNRLQAEGAKEPREHERLSGKLINICT